MDMNKAFFLKKEAKSPQWRVIDATDKTLGRLATEVANVLRGKNKSIYTPHTDAGDYVVIVNAEKVHLTGDKWDGKVYDWYTGWFGGHKYATAKELMAKDPTFLVRHAVKGMLPKNKLSNQAIKKLKVYAGSEHPHKAQAR